MESFLKLNGEALFQFVAREQPVLIKLQFNDEICFFNQFVPIRTKNGFFISTEFEHVASD